MYVQGFEGLSGDEVAVADGAWEREGGRVIDKDAGRVQLLLARGRHIERYSEDLEYASFQNRREIETYACFLIYDAAYYLR